MAPASNGVLQVWQTPVRQLQRVLLLPVPIRLDLVHQDRPLLAAVSVGVALTVPVDVEPSDFSVTVYRVFPYAGVHGLAMPGHGLGMPTFTDSRNALSGSCFWPLSVALRVPVPVMAVRQGWFRRW